MKTFQKPLTHEEERYYLEKLKAGDLEARQVLIERNMRLVAHVVKKYQGVDEELDDLISVGTIGLIKAVSTFNPDKGSRLATYAARCVDNELLMLLRSRKKISKDVSLYEPIGTDKEGNEIHLLDIMEGKEKDISTHLIKEEEQSHLYKILHTSLTDREQLILRYRYGLYGEKELTQREIAKRLNISRSYVSRIEKTALEKLRSRFLSS
ncbi:MAG: RNA polymerase sporulation sigma factor SigK [Lachnospiraceae bacterium]|nr:RNA polymerase sporulation sigma factor SigK [Lachnospiraceae bacterium]MDD3616458.1 RNA polymerase sporulation sigma factor SigK [Lachnospiraceae bacterium]